MIPSNFKSKFEKKAPGQYYREMLPWPEIMNDILNVISYPSLSKLIGLDVQLLRSMVSRKSEPKESIARSLLLIHKDFVGQAEYEIRLDQRFYV